jgi:DNA-binding SARP family transcriptional activator
MTRDPAPDAKTAMSEYGQWPTVWPPPPPRTRRTWRDRLYAVAAAVRSLLSAAFLLLGVPALLWWVWGNPVDRLPTGQQLTDWLDQPDGRLSEAALAGAAIWIGWLIWAALAVMLLAAVVTAVTRIRLPVPTLPAPLHKLLFGLAGTAAITLGAAGRATTASGQPPAHAAPAPAALSADAQDGPVAGPATILIGDARYSYTVQRGDTLSKISRDWLGTPDRWPQICRLNKHRHFPNVGGVLRDCDLIYPGWDLRLPADATPPATAKPQPRTPPPKPTPRQPDPTSTPPVDPDGVVAEPAQPSTPAPTTSADPGDSDVADAPARSSDDGVELPGGFVPWSLAAAITSAAALVWLHRRRRHQPGQHLDDPDLAEPVTELHRHVLRNPNLATPADLAERAAAVPELPWPPPGGVGVTGPGAHAAARAALVSALASGGPADPDRRGEVIIDHTTWITLFDTEPPPTGSWPRLHIAADLDHALTMLDSRLLHRARILDEHAVHDIDTLRRHAPAEEALPPVLLITHAPPSDVDNRARTTLGLGAGMHVTALMLGPWERGTTIDVDSDGRTSSVGEPAAGVIGERVAVLDPASALAVLATLREGHTGQPAEQAVVPRPAVGAAQTLRGDAEPAQQPSADDAVVSRPKARLCVLGTPRVDDLARPGRPLRAKAAELAVYLACHPDGADTATITDVLLPDTRMSTAKQQVHTNASNLRHVLGRAGGPIPAGYLLKRGPSARYRLDPDTVEVDLWRLRDLLARAQRTSPPRRTELLREACDLYAAPLADGCHYDWVEPHRERARQWATEAHLLLADDLIGPDPQAAADVLDKAIGLDRYNEELYRKAMHARHALRDAEGIRALLRALTKAIADLDAEPAEATVELAARLRDDLQQR